MKKIPFLLLLLLSVSMFSQEKKEENSNKNTQEIVKKNELKLNGLALVAGAFNVKYERILNDNTGIGISGLLPISKDIRDDIQYYVSPFFRKYFGEKYAAGFFAEAFGMLNSTDRSAFLSNSDKYITDFALGVGVGGKWITKGGFVAELSLSFGRNLFNRKESSVDVIGTAGITLGYRF